MSAIKTVNAIQSNLGVPAEEVKRVAKKEKFLACSLGDLTLNMERVVWPVKGTVDEWQDPVWAVYATVRGYNNSNGYSVQISLAGDLKSWATAKKFCSNIQEFITKTGIELGKTFEIDNLEAALEAAKD